MWLLYREKVDGIKILLAETVASTDCPNCRTWAWKASALSRERCWNF
jgi:hypothetical protein